MKILIVDDSKAMRMIVTRTLRQAGFADHDYLEAADGAEGLAVVAAERPDLVLSDWNMPEVSGIEFLQKLRASGYDTRFGFVTSESTDVRLATIWAPRSEIPPSRSVTHCSRSSAIAAGISWAPTALR